MIIASPLVGLVVLLILIGVVLWAVSTVAVTSQLGPSSRSRRFKACTRQAHDSAV